MARKHARLLVTVWDDPEWVALPSLQQTVYLAILSSRDLSWAGVNPLLPARLAGVCADANERRVTAAIDALESARFLVVDKVTAEVAVRTFVRHDELIEQPNVAKAMARAVDQIRSATIRASVIRELARVLVVRPDARGWRTLAEVFPDLMEEVSEEAIATASVNPSPNPSRKGSRNPSGNPSPNPSVMAS